MQHTQIEMKAIPEGCKLLEVRDHFMALKKHICFIQETRVGCAKREFQSLQLWKPQDFKWLFHSSLSITRI